jgi:hypothetical protein
MRADTNSTLRLNQVCFLWLILLVFISFLGMSCPNIELVNDLGTYSVQEFLREDTEK